MKYFSEDENYINAECKKCGKVLKVKKERCITYSYGFSVNPPINCSCENISNRINKPTKTCPKCGSTQIAVGQVFCNNCKQVSASSYSPSIKLSNNVTEFIITAIIVILFGFAVVTLVNLGQPEPDPNRPDFRLWFEKDKSEWTEKDRREYLRDHIKMMEEDAQREKGY